MLDAQSPASSAQSMPAKVPNNPAGTCPHPVLPNPATDIHPNLGPQTLILNTFCSKPFILFLNYISFLDYKSDTLERTQPLRGSCRNGHGH